MSWMRSGAGPEVWRVAFESSADGVNYAPLGDANRIPGGWELTGLDLPRGVNSFIRARGYYSTGFYNGSGSIIESVRMMFLAPAPFSKTQPSDTASNQTLDPTLSWAGSDGASSYEYCLDTSDNETCDTGWVSVANTTSAALAGLSNSTTYFWQVRALTPAGTTSADNGTWWTFTTAAEVNQPKPDFSIFLPLINR
jgi:hypothetical protein